MTLINSQTQKKLSRIQQIRREHIVQTAITAINRDGYAATSLDKIAAEAQIKKSTVLYHFKSKNAINEAIMNKVTQAGTSAIVKSVRQKESYQEKLSAYIVSNIQFIAEHVHEITALHHIVLNTSFKTYDGDAAVLQLENLLKAGQKKGELGKFNAHIMSVTIRLAIDGASFYIADHPKLDIDIYAKELSQIFFKATQLENRKEVKR